jgi:beta-lactamase class A
MISISDNTATNLLIRRAGMEQVNATMRELGMTCSNLGREMKGRPAVPGETENWATADDYVTIIQAILDHEAASPASCEAMTVMLERQQNARRIARHLPQSDDIRWGTKTGSINEVTNDAGFVITPNGRLIIAVFCEGMADQHLGEEAIGAISRAAFEATGILP